MSDHEPQALYPEPTRFAALFDAARSAGDPANLAMLPAILGSLIVIAVDTSMRLAIVLTLTALLLIVARLRHAVPISVLLLTGFAIAALLHPPTGTAPPPVPQSHHGS